MLHSPAEWYQASASTTTRRQLTLQWQRSFSVCSQRNAGIRFSFLPPGHAATARHGRQARWIPRGSFGTPPETVALRQKQTLHGRQECWSTCCTSSATFLGGWITTVPKPLAKGLCNSPSNHIADVCQRTGYCFLVGRLKAIHVTHGKIWPSSATRHDVI